MRLLRADVNSMMEKQGPSTLEAIGQRLDKIETSIKEKVQAPEPATPLEGETRDRKDDRDSIKEKDHSANKHSSRRSRHDSRATRKHHLGDSSSSESSDSEDDHSSDSSSSSGTSRSGERRSRRHRDIGKGGVHLRRKGRKHRGLRALRPTNHLYDVLLDYRVYRLKRKSSSRSGRETGKVKDHIRRLATAMNGMTFDGSDPISVLGFLARFVEECDILEMKESRAFLALPYFLEKNALAQCRAARDSPPYEGGISVWPEAIQYLLRNYATNNAINEAILELRDIKQKSQEDETAYSTRLMTAEFRCGNVHSTEEKMTMFIDGLDLGIRSLVARFREEQRDRARRCRLFTYLDLVRFAQNEGKAYRARNPRTAARHTPLRGTATSPRQRPARDRKSQLLMESSEDSGPSGQVRYRISQVGEGLYLLPESGSIETSELPSSQETAEESESTLLMQGRPRTTPAPRVPYLEQTRHIATSRPGWVGAPRGASRTASPKPNVVCYRCFQPERYAPDCKEDIFRAPEKVVNGYESLPAIDREHVPADAYEKEKILAGMFNTRLARRAEPTTPSGEDAQPGPTQGN